MTRIINSNSGWSERFLKQNAFSTYSWKFLRSRITRIQLGKSFNIARALINLIYQTEMTQAPANVKKNLTQFTVSDSPHPCYDYHQSSRLRGGENFQKLL